MQQKPFIYDSNLSLYLDTTWKACIIFLLKLLHLVVVISNLDYRRLYVCLPSTILNPFSSWPQCPLKRLKKLNTVFLASPAPKWHSSVQWNVNKNLLRDSWISSYLKQENEAWRGGSQPYCKPWGKPKRIVESSGEGQQKCCPDTIVPLNQCCLQASYPGRKKVLIYFKLSIVIHYLEIWELQFRRHRFRQLWITVPNKEGRKSWSLSG
jgi:hypothetical protein